MYVILFPVIEMNNTPGIPHLADGKIHCIRKNPIALDRIKFRLFLIVIKKKVAVLTKRLLNAGVDYIHG